MSIAEELRTRYSEIGRRLRPPPPIAKVSIPAPVPAAAAPPVEPELCVLELMFRAPGLEIPDKPKYPLVKTIQAVVGKHYKVSVIDLVSSRRAAAFCGPRHVAMYLAKLLTPKSYPEIGRLFGGKDHTTVLHAARKITKQRAEDPELSETLGMLTRQIMAI